MSRRVCAYDEEGIKFDVDEVDLNKLPKNFFVFANQDNEDNNTIGEFDE